MAVSERLKSDPQALYDHLQTLRFKLTALTKDRKEQLGKKPKYAELTKESTALRAQKKSIEAEFDSTHESMRESIDNTKADISAHELALMGHALDAHRLNMPLNITKKAKNGKVRKIVVSFKATFKQLSLFE